MRAITTTIALLATTAVGALFGLLVGLGLVPLPGIGPPAGVGSMATTFMSALLGAISGGFFGGVLCLFVLSIVSRRTDLR